MTTADTLFKQAFEATQQGNNELAMLLYRQVLQLDPGHFGCNYMLACECVHERQPEMGRGHFRQALQREPGHVLCRFQAGLLELTSANLAACIDLWSPLEQQLAPGHYLMSFVQGCLAMARDDFSEARAFLAAGIAGNQENPPLNRDMQMLMMAIPVPSPATVPTESGPAMGDARSSTLESLHLFQHSKTKH